MEYILMISVMLHLLSFYLIILLFQRQKLKGETSGQTAARDIEDLLLAYTTEMKENNEALVKELQDKSRNVSTESLRPARKEISNPKPADTISEKQVSGESDYKPPAVAREPQEKIETSQTAQVLSLSNQGFSIEDIARKLNMGKGEVELFLKFYK
ncbi:DUF6115 domain-containing protein [Alteribacter keqinensis]|uniref:Swarming motility protein SwrB n=1 Tax=Alteribacter keqinensis TaxID=2483800 RepID=A0A3M7TVA9_9BACI|nr:hypothetical protein [Alteribacter keqinensis]RNA69566.1 hypothetical protein EBO34_06415 [Alteribacter keqinensis]